MIWPLPGASFCLSLHPGEWEREHCLTTNTCRDYLVKTRRRPAAPGPRVALEKPCGRQGGDPLHGCGQGRGLTRKRPSCYFAAATPASVPWPRPDVQAAAVASQGRRAGREREAGSRPGGYLGPECSSPPAPERGSLPFQGLLHRQTITLGSTAVVEGMLGTSLGPPHWQVGVLTPSAWNLALCGDRGLAGRSFRLGPVD